jgi:isopenicillin-N epimerase
VRAQLPSPDAERSVKRELAGHWNLVPEVVFLNHGSFGACPQVVLELQTELRDRMESQPVEFFSRLLPPLLDEAREELARFVGAAAEDLVAVANVTTGVNTALRSAPLGNGDELLVTDHAYAACRNALDFVAGRRGARVVVAHLPFPLSAPDQVTEAILARVTPRTKLAVIDHVTSPTGLVLPLSEIVRRLRERNIDTLVDGAHAPGMVELNLGRLGATYYTGNCHKWLCAPKGSAFLWVAGHRRESVRPLVVSHGYSDSRPGRSRLHDEFDWTGTADPTPFLCVPRAIEFFASLVSGGWPEVRRRNRDLALEARSLIARRLGVRLPCPDGMVGSLAAIPLPSLIPRQLQRRLLTQHGIEVPVIEPPVSPLPLVRISTQLYNERAQYERLAHALEVELERA